MKKTKMDNIALNICRFCKKHSSSKICLCIANLVGEWSCVLCGKTLKTKKILKMHILRCQKKAISRININNRILNLKNINTQFRRQQMMQKGGSIGRRVAPKRRTYLGEILKTFTVSPSMDVKGVDIMGFFHEKFNFLKNILLKQLMNLRGLKTFSTLKLTFVKYNSDGSAIYTRPYIRSKTLTVTNKHEIEETLTDMMMTIMLNIDNYAREGSGHSVIAIHKLM
jgi:hypothetical protein